MEIEIEMGQLAKALTVPARVAKGQGPLTVYNHVLLDAADGMLRITATDLETTVTSRVPCDVAEPGKALVRCKEFAEFAKRLRVERATITAKATGNIEIHAGDAMINLVGLPPVEFPRIDKPDETDLTTVSTVHLSALLDGTMRSISSDVGRPNLMGAHFSSEDGKLRAVSTDGNRLARLDREIPGEFKGEAIVPAKGCEAIAAMMVGETAQIGVSGRDFVCSADAVTLQVRRVDAKFPSVEQVIPAWRSDIVFLVDKAEFLTKLAIVSVCENARTRLVTISVDDGVLSLSSEDPEKGVARETMPVEGEVKVSSVGFNSKHLADALAPVGTEKFRAQVISFESAVLFAPDDESGDLFLVMPQRL